MNRARIDEALREVFAREVGGAAFRGARVEEIARARAAAEFAATELAATEGRDRGARSAAKFFPAAMAALAMTAAGLAAIITGIAGSAEPAEPARSVLAASISAALPDDPAAALAAILEDLRIDRQDRR